MQPITQYKKGSCRTINDTDAEKIRKDWPHDHFFQDVADRFRVLSDPTRLKIVYVLSLREMCVYDIATMLDMAQSAVSHQLRILKQAKVVSFRKDGRMVCYSLTKCDITKLFSMVSKQLAEEK